MSHSKVKRRIVNINFTLNKNHIMRYNTCYDSDNDNDKQSNNNNVCNKHDDKE